jgi:hypothetical protein
LGITSGVCVATPDFRRILKWQHCCIRQLCPIAKLHPAFFLEDPDWHVSKNCHGGQENEKKFGKNYKHVLTMLRFEN